MEELKCLNYLLQDTILQKVPFSFKEISTAELNTYGELSTNTDVSSVTVIYCFSSLFLNGNTELLVFKELVRVKRSCYNWYFGVKNEDCGTGS